MEIDWLTFLKGPVKLKIPPKVSVEEKIDLGGLIRPWNGRVLDFKMRDARSKTQKTKRIEEDGLGFLRVDLQPPEF
ncbi:hypothetical protein GWI33_007417 [Rhynchophorus ferrugineus]|uniref:Uncharacterized protein n=1 Tax=Rhynchophorus ferrugineus TaxID=354439 RepID=A0A834MC77_RHYFE|nr:hypothetical protein GWI33_007417 [Rhynchophorus ferrugineus]